jgi:Protein of unknown function (DUF3344)
LGDLVAGQDSVIGFTVSASGDGPATNVTATVALPPGVTLTGTEVRSGAGFGLGAAVMEPVVVSGAWSCLGVAQTVTCTDPAFGAGGSSTVYLGVSAAPDSAGTTPVSVTVDGDGLTQATTTGTAGVAATGISARWAGQGHLAVTEVGAPLLTCPILVNGCADAQAGNSDGGRVSLNNNDWAMTPVDVDADPTTEDSSRTTLAINSGANVVFAGLYWSGDTPANTSEATLGSARLTDPSGTQSDITAERVDQDHSNGDTYQSFADVTDEVRASGSGSWTLAGVAVKPGSGDYAGWSLVVVYGDSSKPAGKVSVFEGFQAVNTGDTVAFTVAGTAGETARIGLVAWEGDAGFDGDTLTLNGSALTPTSGLKSPNNIADSTATGAADANSFGVDAKALSGGTFTSDEAPLVARTTQDGFLIGVVTVSSAG